MIYVFDHIPGIYARVNKILVAKAGQPRWIERLHERDVRAALRQARKELTGSSQLTYSVVASV